MEITSGLFNQVTSPVSTRFQIASLGSARFIESVIQLLTPLVLVRLFDMDDFGKYRIFWLVASTALLLAPMGMVRSLMFFLPRSEKEEKIEYVYQVVVFLAGTGCFAALLCGPWSPLLPGRLRVTDPEILISLFLFLWIFSSALDLLPNCDERITWQAGATICLAFFRVICVVSTATITRDINSVFLVLIFFGCVKLAVLFFYITRYHGWPPRLSLKKFYSHVSLAAAFGFNNILFNFSRQAEQWIVALLFSSSAFALFSVGAIQIPVINILRRAVSDVILPKISAAQKTGDYNRVLRLNQNGNLVAGFIVFPIAAFFFVYAKQAISIIFTDSYIPAAPVLQVYLFGMVRMAIDASSILLVFSQKAYVIRVGIVLLIISLAASYIGARNLGIMGAAIGSVASLYIGAFFNYSRAASLVGVSLREFQNWRSIALIAFSSAASAGLCRLIGAQLFSNMSPIVQIGSSAVLFCFFYPAMLVALDLGWLLKAVATGSGLPER